MNSIFSNKVSRESISADIALLSRKYFELPEVSRAKMSEQDVRDYFITPLLEALGWGVVDPRERSAERYLPRQGFSDYELCLPLLSGLDDPYVPVVYVEAKKFGTLAPLEPDLFGYAKRSDADIQVIEYADQFNPKRGEKIGWAILTNFEVLRVWDTRRNVLVLEVDWFTALASERALELLFLLSRDQVAQDPSLRSLSAYRQLPDIDEKFLAKLNEWRISLANAVWSQTTNRTKLGMILSDQQAALRTVVQRTLDRLIVIRTAEDRGLLPPQYRLQEMVRNFGGQNAVPLMLLENIQRNTFSYFDHHFNSKLFGPHLADSMEVHNVPLSRIIDEMSTASFVSMNADILGATYEQYLGQTVEIDAKTDAPRLVTNLETRHAQGSYYTPRIIVQSIVDNTVARYLSDGDAKADNKLRASRKKIRDIQDLSILDPACGSGSFLIYVFDVLLEFYQSERARIQSEIDQRTSAIVAAGIPRLAAEAHHDPTLLALRSELELTRFAPAKIIERHLYGYGVDLDPQAVEVASMNLLLKALTRNQRLPRILGDNIKVGNSLVSGIQIEESIQPYAEPLTELIAIRNEVHAVTLMASENGDDRPAHEATLDALDHRFRERASQINIRLNEKLYSNEGSGWFSDLAEVRPFNWQIEFPEKFDPACSEHGFTFVLGNPPYVGFHGFSDQKQYLRDSYSAASGKFDLYVPFLERGIKLTKRGGELSYICPSTFMKRGFGQKLRQFILKRTHIRALHDFQHLQVFRNVLNYTCIPILVRDESDTTKAIQYSEGPLESEPRFYEQDKLDDGPWIFRFGEDEALVERIQADDAFVELGNAAISSGVSEGIVTACNSVLLISEADVIANSFETTYLKKCLRGEDVKRYAVSWGGFFVFYPYERIDGTVQVVDEKVLEAKCPKLYAYLASSSEKLLSRKYMQGTKKKWYELWCQRDIADQGTQKIVVPEIADRSQFALVDSEYFYVDTTCGIGIRKEVDPWYVVGILNSRPAEILYRKTTVPKANGYLIYKTMFLNPFRIPDPRSVSKDTVQQVALLSQSIQRNNAQAIKVESAFAQLIDAAVPAAIDKFQNFQQDYYNVVSNWTERRFLIPEALHLREPVASIRVDGGTGTEDESIARTTLRLSYQIASTAEWRPLIQLWSDNPDLILFLHLAIRRFLRENSRKNIWRLPGKNASKRTVDVVLQSLVLPIWNLGPGTRNEVTRQKVAEIVGALRKRFANNELNPSILELANRYAESEIDKIVFALYRMNPDK